MQKYYIHTKTKIVLGFLVAIPFIITEVISGYIWWRILEVIRMPVGWVSKESFDNHLWYYAAALGVELLTLYLIGLWLSPFDEQIDAFMKKIPLIGYIYSKVNDFFTTKKTPKGVPIVLNIYGSKFGSVTCYIPSFEKRWLFVDDLDEYQWCYTIVPPPNVQPIGGHNQHFPCDYIEKKLAKQTSPMAFDQLLTYCITCGMVFPKELTQKNKEDLMPLFLLK